MADRLRVALEVVVWFVPTPAGWLVAIGIDRSLLGGIPMAWLVAGFVLSIGCVVGGVIALERMPRDS